VRKNRTKAIAIAHAAPRSIPAAPAVAVAALVASFFNPLVGMAVFAAAAALALAEG